jgi:hypothetical protein
VPEGAAWASPRERCEECGFEYEPVSPADAATALRSFGKRYRAPLTRFHARDAIRFNTYMARRALTEDDPSLPSPNPDKTASDERYNEQDPAVVADELAQRAEKAAAMVESTEAGDWGRTAQWGDRGEYTALYFVRNAVHEGHHHLLDVGRVLRHVREAAKA